MEQIMTPAESQAIEFACTKLVNQFAVYSDDYVLTAAGWKIRQRSGRLVFTT
jgi:hypothetical protein